ncbi:MAG: hypothetical protein U0704_15735, partial [Candidatus Eisenbacteria bacterium]
PEAEDPPGDRFPPMPLTIEQSFYEFLCGPRQYHGDLSRFIAAYRAITAAETETPLRIVPHEERIIGRLVLPLRRAKAAFVLGDYLGVVALGGIVAEMAAMLLYELADLGLDDQQQALTFGRSFVNLGQERRVEVLKVRGLLDERQLQWFGSIRGIRRKDLHFLDEPAPTETEALTVYRAALGLVATTIGTPPTESSFGLSDQVMALLRRKGLVWNPEDEPEGPGTKARVGIRLS